MIEIEVLERISGLCNKIKAISKEALSENEEDQKFLKGIRMYVSDIKNIIRKRNQELLGIADTEMRAMELIVQNMVEHHLLVRKNKE